MKLYLIYCIAVCLVVWLATLGRYQIIDWDESGTGSSGYYRGYGSGGGGYGGGGGFHK